MSDVVIELVVCLESEGVIKLIMFLGGVVFFLMMIFGLIMCVV